MKTMFFAGFAAMLIIDALMIGFCDINLLESVVLVSVAATSVRGMLMALEEGSEI